jgi:drug/metabolite transporter (DMT)-like permease
MRLPDWRSIPVFHLAPSRALPLDALTIVAAIALNQLFNVGATAGFKFSADAATTRDFLIWQFVGNMFGLGTVLSFTWLIRATSLPLANAIGIGLAFVSVQVFSAYLFFRTPFTPVQWFGTALVFGGILFIAWGAR